MIKTFFYTFLETKHQEENADPTSANYPLFPQEIEIRPIPPFPWKILKTLTIDEIWDGGRFQLWPEQIQDTVLSYLSHHDRSCINSKIFKIEVRVKDLDTNTFHGVILWKFPHEDQFSMRGSWIDEFVKRRRLMVGMVISMYWSFEDQMFCFSVLQSRE